MPARTPLEARCYGFLRIGFSLLAVHNVWIKDACCVTEKEVPVFSLPSGMGNTRNTGKHTFEPGIFALQALSRRTNSNASKNYKSTTRNREAKQPLNDEHHLSNRMVGDGIAGVMVTRAS
mmetsp:Transcript_21263/g.50554  ORF Transcript_21263/g.50554 Transcript_21263/m.50554 type:complete len:120 (+) Transcript_21263:169-528(+)